MATEKAEKAEKAEKSEKGEGLARGPSLYKLDPYKVIVPQIDAPIAVTDPLYDERALLSITELRIKELAAQIMASKRCLPIDFVTRDGDPWTVAGRRRTLAMRLVWDQCAKEGVAPPDFFGRKVGGSADDLATASFIENMGRFDSPPMTLAHTVAREMESRDWDLAFVAAMMGETQQSVKNLLSLLKLDPRVQAAISDGKVGPTVGYELARAKPAQQIETLEKLLSTGKKVRATDARLAVQNLPQLPAGGVVEGVFEGDEDSPKDSPKDMSEDTVRGGKKAKKVKAKKAAAKPEPEPSSKYEPPTAAQARRLLAKVRSGDYSVKEDDLDENVLKMLRLMAGELTVRGVPGLYQAFKETGIALKQLEAKE